MWIILSESLSKKKKKSSFDFIDFNNIYVLAWIFLWTFSFLVFLIFSFYNFIFLWKFDNFTKEILDYNNKKIIIEWDWKKFKWLNFQENFLKKIELQVKKISEDKQKNLVWKLNFALPNILKKEFVIKFFEDLFLTISSKEEPVILNSVNVWWATSWTAQIWNDKIDYKKYPISLWFSCSDKEFDRILDIIQVSWLFDKRYYFRWEILPVMTVSSVAMNFEKNNKKVVDNSQKSRSLQIFMYSYWDKKIKIKK